MNCPKCGGEMYKEDWKAFGGKSPYSVLVDNDGKCLSHEVLEEYRCDKCKSILAIILNS